MDSGWIQPRLAIAAGVVLLVTGYAALRAGPVAIPLQPAACRVAFYGGLALLIVGVVTWLRQPPGPDPADNPGEPDNSEGD